MKENSNELGWFRKLQKNSWNPEVIISGFALAFILVFPKSLYEFAAKMIQDWGVNYLGGLLVLIYSSFLLNVFKIFLITHLALRFVWTGMLGVSYAFPEGVINERLPSYVKGFEFGNLKDYTLKLERICSLFFGIPTYLAFIFIPITLYLGVLITIYKLLDLSFFMFYILFMVSILLFVIYGLVISKLKKNVKAKNLFSTLGAVYQSNLGNLRFNFVQLLIFLVTIPFIIHDTRDFTLFFHEVSLTEEQVDWPDKSWYIENQRDADSRFGRILIPSESIEGDFLKLNIAYYGEDLNYLKELNGDFKMTLDTLSWHSLSVPTDLYRISIDDSVYSELVWKNVIKAGSNQKAYESYVNIGDLQPGLHTIRLEKLAMRMEFFTDSEPKLRKDWAVFDFFKN
ncbi:hypothetical protein MM213_07935 [Belliella sp. R4-6]|uniref:Uncharacterized protein n=1 Tax=Belliella alkalica TaxID=1730871 RepID=A0ABS9VAY9_9BACT|nr:hypothetical protein [Belliella alkalica]MCH7413409.1 hypothetical protein [Belliella alkalica]